MPAETRLGVFICYESIFPDEIRQFANNGAQVLVNISNDGWYGDSGAYAQHLKQSRMRAVENDRWLLLDTNTGVTAAIDPYGRIVASVPRKTRTALQAPYALSQRTTFYTRHGDWFAYLCAIISIAALFMRLLFAMKRDANETQQASLRLLAARSRIRMQRNPGFAGCTNDRFARDDNMAKARLAIRRGHHHG